MDDYLQRVTCIDAATAGARRCLQTRTLPKTTLLPRLAAGAIHLRRVASSAAGSAHFAGPRLIRQDLQAGDLAAGSLDDIVHVDDGTKAEICLVGIDVGLQQGKIP